MTYKLKPPGTDNLKPTTPYYQQQQHYYVRDTQFTKLCNNTLVKWYYFTR